MRLKPYQFLLLIVALAAFLWFQGRAMWRRGIDDKPLDLCYSISEERFPIARDLVSHQSIEIYNQEVTDRRTGFRKSFLFMKSLTACDPVVMMSRGSCVTVSLCSTFFLVRQPGVIEDIMTAEQFSRMGNELFERCVRGCGVQEMSPADSGGSMGAGTDDLGGSEK